MNSAYELGRALNPKLVEQQLVGGAWMGMSHALYETPEPYYPDPQPRPARLQRISDAGPRRHLRRTTSRCWNVRRRTARSAARVRARCAPIRCCRRSPMPIFNAVGVRIDDLPITPGKGAARASRRRAARGRRRGGEADMAVRRTIVGIDEPATRSHGALRDGLLSRRRRARDRRPISRWRSASRCCWKARRASARPRPRRPSPSCSGAQLIRLQCYEGIDAVGRALRMELSAPDARDPPGRRGAASTSTRDDFLIERPMLAALRRAGLDRAADRRNRPLRPGVRGLPARIPVRLLRSRSPSAARMRAAERAGRDPDLEPHARPARGAAAPLRLSLDRLSRPGARGADRDDARRHRGARAPRARSSPRSGGCGASR